jgi:hypothetical protein
MKKRILKKWYNRAIENLKLEQEKFVNAQKQMLQREKQIQCMHERAIRNLTEERDQLRKIMSRDVDIKRSKSRLICHRFMTDSRMVFGCDKLPALSCVVEPYEIPYVGDLHNNQYMLRMYIESPTGKITEDQRRVLEYVFKEVFCFMSNPDKGR